ncbi:MAG: hypothetical protein AAFR65_11430 [Pseudomonadota bacterium]
MVEKRKSWIHDSVSAITAAPRALGLLSILSLPWLAGWVADLVQSYRATVMAIAESFARIPAISIADASLLELLGAAAMFAPIGLSIVPQTGKAVFTEKKVWRKTLAATTLVAALIPTAIFVVMLQTAFSLDISGFPAVVQYALLFLSIAVSFIAAAIIILSTPLLFIASFVPSVIFLVIGVITKTNYLQTIVDNNATFLAINSIFIMLVIARRPMLYVVGAVGFLLILNQSVNLQEQFQSPSRAETIQLQPL